MLTERSENTAKAMEEIFNSITRFTTNLYTFVAFLHFILKNATTPRVTADE
jgi:hypothetical protein